MRHIFRWAFLLCIMCIYGYAEVPGGDGNDLQDQCSAALAHETGARAGICAGFVNAYRQLAAMLPDQKLLCLPSSGIGNEQFIKILMKYLNQHPERLHLPAAQLIYDAMQESFPCSTK